MRSRLPSMLQRSTTAGGLSFIHAAWRHGSGRHKAVTAEDAVHLIRSGSTITVGGFVTQGAPEELLKALGDRYRQTGEPKNLTLLFEGGPGDYDKRGLNHLAQPGLLRRAIGSHYGQTPLLAKLVQDNQIEAYLLPMGCISRMIRAAATGQPGHLTTVGFGTFVDPKLGGGKANAKTTEDLVHEVEILGKKYLLYSAVPIDVALIRGTTGDPDGNLTFEHESLYNDHLNQAMAAHASANSTKGVVIAQVKRLSAAGSLHPRQVRVPGTMVSCVVVATDPAATHGMSYVTQSNPGATAEIRLAPTFEVMPLDERKIVARRACLELARGDVVNLGIGMPEGVAIVADEEKILSNFELTTEPGVHGGVGLSGHDFGPAVNYSSLLELNQQFDFYNGGGLDICFLGMAEVCPAGNVNVTRVGPKLTGPGGFVDISQCTKRVNLLGTFTAGGLEVAAADGKLTIVKEGKTKKFVKSVREVTFNGAGAFAKGQQVRYITERCVFSLTKGGLELSEIAPGIDLQKQVLDLMDFRPLIRDPLPLMDPSIFHERLMQLQKRAYGMRIEGRLHHNKEAATAWIDLSDLQVTTRDELTDLKSSILTYFDKLGKKQYHAVVSYDKFDLVGPLVPEWLAFCETMARDYHLSVRRYATGTLTRHKLACNLGVEEGSFTLDRALAACKRLGLAASESVVRGKFAAVDTEKTGFITGAQLKQIQQELAPATQSHPN